MFGRDPVLRISGRVIFELGGYGIATGAAGATAVGFEGAGVVADKFDVVAGTKNRFPRRDGESGEEIKGVFGVV